MTQPGFIFARDSHVLDPVEQKRLSGQSLKILQRLQEGPASRRQLTEIALNCTARVSDLRAAGYDIRCTYDKVTGQSVYRLETK